MPIRPLLSLLLLSLLLAACKTTESRSADFSPQRDVSAPPAWASTYENYDARRQLVSRRALEIYNGNEPDKKKRSRLDAAQQVDAAFNELRKSNPNASYTDLLNKEF